MYSYIVEVEVKEIPQYLVSEQPHDIFNRNDRNFLTGEVMKKPDDFNLHLAVYLLMQENIPDELIDPVKRWVSENKYAGSHYR